MPASWSLQVEASTECTLQTSAALEEFAEGQELGWLPQWAMMQGRCCGSKMIHALPKACRASFRRIWADDESIKATAEADNDVRQSISSEGHRQVEVTRTAADVATSAKQDQAAAPVCTPSVS